MALDDESIEVLKQRKGIIETSVLVNTYTFRIDAISDVKIVIRIWFDPWQRSNPYRYELSHLAATPVQASAYLPSAPWFRTEAIALEHGIRAIAEWVDEAEQKGHEPSTTWLRDVARSEDE